MGSIYIFDRIIVQIVSRRWQEPQHDAEPVNDLRIACLAYHFSFKHYLHRDHYAAQVTKYADKWKSASVSKERFSQKCHYAHGKCMSNCRDCFPPIVLLEGRRNTTRCYSLFFPLRFSWSSRCNRSDEFRSLLVASCLMSSFIPIPFVPVLYQWQTAFSSRRTVRSRTTKCALLVLLTRRLQAIN